MLVPLAGAVAHSRVHTGTHWPSDVLTGAVVGVGLSLATQRWWPVRPLVPGLARPSGHVAELSEGDGLALLVNPSSGDNTRDPIGNMSAVWPAAKLLRPDPDNGVIEGLHRALDADGPGIRALGLREATVPWQQPHRLHAR